MNTFSSKAFASAFCFHFTRINDILISQWTQRQKLPRRFAEIRWMNINIFLFQYCKMASAPNHPFGKSLFESDKDASSGVVLVSLLTIFHMLWTCFLPCWSVYIVNFEHVIAGWDSASVRMHLINFRNELRIDLT